MRWWRDIVRAVLHGFREGALDARSAQFAYYALFLLPPTLIILISILSQLPVDGVVEGTVTWAEKNMPEGAYSVLAGQVEEIRKGGTGGLFWVAVLLVTVSGTRLFVRVGRGVNAAFGIEETRPAWKVWGTAALLGLICFLLVVVSSTSLVLGPLVDEKLHEYGHFPAMHFLLSSAGSTIVFIVAALLAASLTYQLLPNRGAGWRPVTTGSLFAVATWLAFSYGFRVYVGTYGRYNETYGALAGVIILMALLYLTGVTLFTGAQLDAVLQRRAARSAGSKG